MGFSFEEAAEIFEDRLSVTVTDLRHIADERRFFTFDQSPRGRLLTMGHTAEKDDRESSQQGRRPEVSDETMKVEVEDQDMPAEVDFSHGRRGQFAKRMRLDVVYVPLAPDVSEAFKTADEVNSALRLLIKTAAAAMPTSEQKAS